MDDDLQIAQAAAEAGAEVARAGFLADLEVEYKGDVDPVTQVDHAAEAAIIEVLREHRPDDAILAEESGSSGSGGRRWIVDPIDGTVNFVHGIPHFAVSVGLWEGDVPLAGVVIDVMRDEVFAARAGGGAFMNGTPLRVSEIVDIGGAVVAHGFPYDRQVRSRELGMVVGELLAVCQGVRRAGSAALDMAWVAAGRHEGYFESDLAPWDVAAALLLVEEAGGTVTGLDGTPSLLTRGPYVASNRHIHGALLDTLRGAAITLVGTDPVGTAGTVTDERVARFWSRWPAIRTAVEADLAAGAYGAGTEQLTDAIDAIHPELEWELSGGQTAANALCVTSGNSALRPVSQRWRDAAPPADDMWEYHPARIAVGSERFELADMRIDPADARIAVERDDDAEQLTVTVSHPEFRGLDDTLRFQAAFRMIDDLIGEDATERWIGSVDVTDVDMAWAGPISGLPSLVDEIADSATGSRWVVFEDEDTRAGHAEVEVNLAIKRLDFIHFTDYLAVSISYDDPKGGGVPDPSAGRRLEELESELGNTLGDRGVQFARGLFPGVMVVHFFIHPDAIELVDTWAAGHDDVYDVEVTGDPSWDALNEVV